MIAKKSIMVVFGSVAGGFIAGIAAMMAVNPAMTKKPDAPFHLWLKDEIAATVDGRVIPSLVVRMGAHAQANAQENPNESPEKREEVYLQGLIDEEVMAEAARQIKEIMTDPAVVAGIEQQQRNTLAMAYARYESMKIKPASVEVDAALKKFRDAAGKYEYQLQEVYYPIDAENDVKKTLAALLSGSTTFDAVINQARQDGRAVTTQIWAPEGQLVTRFKENIANLKQDHGYFIDNLEDGNGVFIVRLIGKREIKFDVNRVHDLLVGDIQKEKISAIIKDLRKKSNIVVTSSVETDASKKPVEQKPAEKSDAKNLGEK